MSQSPISGAVFGHDYYKDDENNFFYGSQSPISGAVFGLFKFEVDNDVLIWDSRNPLLAGQFSDKKLNAGRLVATTVESQSPISGAVFGQGYCPGA